MKPNLIIIGAMKSGTTSLHNYLQSHADISMSEPKELNFFSNAKFFGRGTDWYESHFRQATQIRGETSTSYTIFPRAPQTAERMHAVVPDARLIYLVRDPLARFVSHYVHYRSDGTERRSFSEVVAASADGQPSPYLDQSRYFRQLEQYLRFYERDRILLVSTEELKHDRLRTLGVIANWLKVPNDFPDAALAEEHNRSSRGMLVRNRWVGLVYPRWLQTHPAVPWKVKSPFFHLARLGATPIEKPAPTPQETATLTELLAEDVQLLEAWRGEPFSGWREYGPAKD